MIRPVRHRSMPWTCPRSRVRRWLPPRPGHDAQGDFRLAEFGGVGGDDEIADHGQFAAAAQGMARHRGDDRLSDARRCGRTARRTDFRRYIWEKVLGAISLMSAPAAKARSMPVTIDAAHLCAASQASSASASSFEQRCVERVQRFGPVQRGDADRAVHFGLDDCSSAILTSGISGNRKSNGPLAQCASPCPGISSFARLALAAIDQEMMLEIAGIAGGLGMVAQGRAAGGDGVLQHFLDRRHQRRDALAS